MISFPSSVAGQENLDLLGKTVSGALHKDVKAIDVVGRDELSKTFSVALADGSAVLAHIANSNMPPVIIESEVATMKFLAERTSIPIPRIVSYEVNAGHPLGPHIIFEKPQGLKLDTLFNDLPPESQDALVVQLAKYMLELAHHTFSSIGSLLLESSPSPSPPAAASDAPSGISFPSLSPPRIGPLVDPIFYVDGRASLPLDRGPFPTARAYFRACAQRELDCARAMFTQGASAEYQRELEGGQLQVERSVGLMTDLIGRCAGLDEDDKALAPFAIDLHGLALKSVFVSETDPTQIESIVDWQCTSTRPLWRCARLPYWLTPSLSEEDAETKLRLAHRFRQTIIVCEGPDSAFLRALDSDDTRHALDEVAEYNAFRDGFLVLPTLESILATLPGEEDVDGLEQMLDPKTLPGRAARISLMTQGSNSLFLAMSPPTSPVLDKAPINYLAFRRPTRYSLPSRGK
ncbi:hypothetical protein EVG20_g4034 [Dentipellis fragilis]|uniref:Aminoglycoside phosphotransferase domain-containing protein n=1 Tax=Dentipellis fragilis TaxID=205917 RepID=A0A4Y9YY41_9AGAM|nr:hypothetical protein EVG20_g4034 [Dentipellis fragilis]